MMKNFGILAMIIFGGIIIKNVYCFDTNISITREFCDQITQDVKNCSKQCIEYEDTCIKNLLCDISNEIDLDCDEDLHQERCDNFEKSCENCKNNEFLEFYWLNCKHYFDKNLTITPKMCSEIMTELINCEIGLRNHNKNCNKHFPILSHKECHMQLKKLQSCVHNKKLIFYKKKCIAENATFNTNLEITTDLCYNISKIKHAYEKQCKLFDLYCIQQNDGSFTFEINAEYNIQEIDYIKKICKTNGTSCNKKIEDEFLQFYITDCIEFIEKPDTDKPITSETCKHYSKSTFRCKQNCDLYKEKCEYCLKDKEYIHYRKECLIIKNQK